MTNIDEIGTRGFGVTSNRSVCLECLRDRGLIRETSRLITERSCSFCGRTAAAHEPPIAADFNAFMRVVMAGVYFVYNHAGNEGVPRNHGDWVGAPIFDSEDVIEDVCGNAVNDDVLEAIMEAVGWEDWTHRRFQQLRPDQAMRLGWTEFCRKVKHEARFVFMSIPQEPSYKPDSFTATEFLTKFVDIIATTGVLLPVPAGRVFWRGRLIDSTRPPAYSAAALGSPPAETASANRMSPAGISMFYGSDDVETAVAEIGAHSTKRYAAVGAFETVRPLTLLNLAALPEVPSLFDSVPRANYYDLRFLHAFAEDLRKPVVLDGREHIEYVPTQVVTEYLRWISTEQIDGILFRSAQTDGMSCVIFCDATGCADPGRENESTYLSYMPGTGRVVKVVPHAIEL
ncbi:hypothetical protein F4553_002315 [Allocatelliglobosispora scoriae]|uniref:RES domain-containing protein n=1 Tax=Allocatelliglobosispora scoriae TaxID=643052 RepID=A0A841BNR5_9ACTN|nr:HEPN-associated N-terminal domain-containing protein [Allocatelliglobosispora scoriae]MBB5868936.1 hypothetical protein [Allocatelliglobosispora scoriae]